MPVCLCACVSVCLCVCVHSIRLQQPLTQHISPLHSTPLLLTLAPGPSSVLRLQPRRAALDSSCACDTGRILSQKHSCPINIQQRRQALMFEAPQRTFPLTHYFIHSVYFPKQATSKQANMSDEKQQGLHLDIDVLSNPHTLTREQLCELLAAKGIPARPTDSQKDLLQQYMQLVAPKPQRQRKQSRRQTAKRLAAKRHQQ